MIVSLMNGDTLSSLNKKLVKSTLYEKPPYEDLLVESLKTGKRIKQFIGTKGYKALNYTEDDAVGSIVFSLLLSFKYFERSNIIINKSITTRIGEDKIKDIKNELDTNLNDTKNGIKEIDKSFHLDKLINELRDTTKIFYLCSEHKDSASDHKPYQGKLYYDYRWKESIRKVMKTQDIDYRTIDKYINQIQGVINRYHMKTIQWVLGKPVYMTTRPNCRHFFIPLTANQVLSYGGKYKNMSKYFNVYFESGYDAKMDSRRNINYAITQYQDRLDYHNEIYKVLKSKRLEMMIKNDRKLLYKWKNALKDLDKS